MGLPWFEKSAGRVNAVGGKWRPNRRCMQRRMQRLVSISNAQCDVRLSKIVLTVLARPGFEPVTPKSSTYAPRQEVEELPTPMAVSL